MDLNRITDLSKQDMSAVNSLIYDHLRSDVALVNQLGFYIVNGGGKRIRPLLTVLAARALDYQGDHHITLAAIIEFIHTATLLHDDVVDESTMRRGKDTANEVFGNQASVLVGDFLYTRSFQMMVSIEKMPVMQILADATNVIAEGEVLQLMNCNDPNTTEESYLKVIYCKTARLFEAATQLAAIIANKDEQTVEAMRLYGMHLGTAFQLIDDVLDYSASSDDLGKNIGDDLSEGKPTLPLIHVINNGTEEQKQLVRDAIEHRTGMDNLDAIMDALKETKAFDYATKMAQLEAQRAIDAIGFLPESEHKQALTALARIAVERKS
ncbi:MAG: octaprenyl diphosphate synthase [Algicola sp.]|nr:octaprenyl diphosphate synthase [Algicola sp.]